MKESKVKLIWKEDGYHVESCRWEGYTYSTWKPYLVHDIFEHRLSDTGKPVDEIRAMGAKLRFDGLALFEEQSGQLFFDNVLRLDENKDKPKIIFKKGRQSLPKLAKALHKFKTPNLVNEYTTLRTLNCGYNHALKYDAKAYMKAWTIDFEKFHKQNIKKDLIFCRNTGNIEIWESN